jgi:nucleotide-binding universal stress UspA family protein
MTTIRHILVPIDFEPSSLRALAVATDLALRFDARMTVLHAWDLPIYAYSSEPYLSTDLWGAIEEAARKQLDETLAGVRKQLPRAEALLVRGRPADEILSAAERLKADFIVVGTHGRSGLNHILLGSVAEKVVRGSPVPVLSVRG